MLHLKSQLHHCLTELCTISLASGVTGTVIGYPLDLIKTRLQVSNASDYKQASFFRTTASIWRTEGARGFFKGLMTPLVSFSVISSICFPCYTYFRVQAGAEKGWDIKNAAAGFACAPVTLPISTMDSLVRVSFHTYLHSLDFIVGSNIV